MKISDSLTPQTVTNLPKLKNEVRLAHSNAIYAVPSSRPVLTRFGWGVVITVCIAIYSAAMYARVSWHKTDSERTFVRGMEVRK